MSKKIPEIDTSVDLLRNIIWQYDGAGAVKELIKQKEEWYNKQHKIFWDNWFTDVFDLRTANDFGLEIWARILGINLFIPDCPSFALTTEQKRFVCRLRYYQLITRCTIPEVNGMLKDMFTTDAGKAYALDPNDMSAIIYVFKYHPANAIKMILAKYDLMPRPATVGIDFKLIPYIPFGFGKYNNNFNQAPFWWGSGLHIDYYVYFDMSFDNDTAILSGKIIAEDEIAVNDIDVLLTYVDSLGNEYNSRVVTDENGSFYDDKISSIGITGTYTVTAKAQVLSPLCTLINVETPFTFIYRISVTSIIPSVSYLELVSNETKTFTVNVLPENADNRGFTVMSSDESIAKVEIVNGIVNVVGLNPGAATLTVIADDNDISATVAIGVVSATQFVMRIDSLTRPIFYASMTENFTVDYGDGIDSTDYSFISDVSGYGWVIPTRNLTIGSEYTITVKNTDTIQFYQALGGTAKTINTLREIILVASSRVSMTNFARGNTGLYKVHDGAFNYLINVTGFLASFQDCTGLLALPVGLFDYCIRVVSFYALCRGCSSLVLPSGFSFSKCILTTTFQYVLYQCISMSELPGKLFFGLYNVTTYQYAIYGCTGLTGLQSTLFAGNKNANTFAQTFQLCTGIKYVGDGLLNDTSAQSLSGMLNGCAKMESNINNIFNLPSYPNVTATTNMLNGCVLATGSGLTLISALPNVPVGSRAGTFTRTTSLTDYNQIPATWGGGGS